MGFLIDQKIVLVTRSTRLVTLKQRYSTVGQAKFHMERAAEIEATRKAPQAIGSLARPKAVESDFSDILAEAETYDDAVDVLKRDLQDLLYVQVLHRDLVPNFVFGPNDVVVTVGQDGLVANTAKYAVNLPIVAVNPDPERFDGILLPFTPAQARGAVIRALERKAKFRQVTLAEASLNDGQRLLAFNDFFIGARTHVSARYRIEFQKRSESHSSSGVLVSTGAGSTGWMSSVFNMAAGLAPILPGAASVKVPPRVPWEDPRLLFVVREPFVSKTSAAGVVAGVIPPGQQLTLESNMPSDGVVFSDGIESDFLQFNSGAVVHINAAKQKAKLVI